MADESDLRDRIDELEAELEDLKAQLPESDRSGEQEGLSRRGAMGLGAIGLGGLLGVGAAESATAANGSVGTRDRPVDVHADSLTVADALSVEELEGYDGDRVALGDPDSDLEFAHFDRADESVVFPDADFWYRGNDLNDVGGIDHSALTGDQRLESLVDGNLSIDDGALQAPSGGGGGGGSSPDLPDNFVGEESFTLHCDPENGDDSNPGSLSEPLETIQEAVDRVPVYNAQHIEIQLAEAPDLPVTYDEDVMVGPYSGYGTDGIAFRIEGDRDNPEDVRVGSMAVHNARGMQSPAIWGMTFTRENDMLSDGAGLFLYASQEPRVDSVAFDPEDGEPLEAGVEAYAGSTVNCRDVDVSNTEHGIKAKRMSTIWATDTHGHAEDYVYFPTHSGRIHWFHNDASPTWGDDIARIANGSICGSRNTLHTRDADMRDVNIRELTVPERSGTPPSPDSGWRLFTHHSGELRAKYEDGSTTTLLDP